MSTASQIVNRYLETFYSGDFETAGALLSPDYHFKGPFLEVSDRKAYLSAAGGLAPVVRGHRLVRQWDDGGEVSSLYEVRLQTPTAEGVVTMSEWHRLSGEQLISGYLLFDTAAFRALLPPR